MSNRAKENLSEIEETQAALRESIESAKELTAQSERLIRRHRDETEDSRILE